MNSSTSRACHSAPASPALRPTGTPAPQRARRALPRVPRGPATRFSLALAALVVAGCGPDRATAPNARPSQAVRPAATSIANLTTAPILYDQRSTYRGDAFSAAGPVLFADDFQVPAGATWSIGQVAISGGLNAATLPLSIRADAGGKPGSVIWSASLAPTASDTILWDAPVYDYSDRSHYLFALPTPVALAEGTYWLVAQSNAGDLYWQRRKPYVGSMYQLSHDDGATWTVKSGDSTDFAFVLFRSGSPQAIAFTSTPPSPAIIGATYTVSATGGESGNPVTFSASPANVCIVDPSADNRAAVSFVGIGTCTLAADQPGDEDFYAAWQTTQTITAEGLAQSITFTSTAPSPARVGSTYTVTATGGASGNPVTFSTSTSSVCTVTGSKVSFAAGGTCTVLADQAGNASYEAAPQATQSFSVSKAAQAITFTSASPAPAYLYGMYAVGVTGGASGNPVVISVSPPNVCTVNGNVVRFVGVGTCTIAANQGGNAAYEAAAQVTQSVKVDYRYAGFLDPVKNDALNVAKAGQVIPLKWRLTDASGAAVTTLAAAAVTAKDLSCTLAGGTKAQVKEDASGSSGLQNLGDGYYQLNWKAPASYSNSCKTLQLDLGEGSGPRTVNFAFTK